MANVLLIGMGPTALSALESLVTRFTVLGVVREVGFGAEAASCRQDDPVALRARDLDIPLFMDVSPTAIHEIVRKLKPGCVVVSSYDRILGPDLLAESRFVNVHYAPLPRYRGRANVNWALINGEGETAITIHTIVPGLDAGNILFQQTLPIGEHDTIADLYAALNEIQRAHLAETVERFLGGDAGTPQPEELSTYGCTRVPADGEIDWTASTARIYALIRALVPPYPGAFTYVGGRGTMPQRLFIWRAQPVDQPPHYVGRVPGRVVGRSRSQGYVDVLTGDGILRLFDAQLEGKTPTAAAEIITSTRATLGLRMSDLLERIQALESQVGQLLARSYDNIAEGK